MKNFVFSKTQSKYLLPCEALQYFLLYVIVTPNIYITVFSFHFAVASFPHVPAASQ